jgi:hypothetical protein
LKDKVYNSNTRTEDELNANIRREIANILGEQLQTINQNLFRWCDEHLHVEGQNFQHLLWSVNYNYFIPNVIGQKAYFFIDKIFRHLAAGFARVNKGENLDQSMSSMLMFFERELYSN